MKYWKYPTTVSSDSDTFIIPDLYLDALPAWAHVKLSQLDDKRGDASDSLNQFNEIMKEMNEENNRKKFYWQSARPVDPEYLTD